MSIKDAEFFLIKHKITLALPDRQRQRDIEREGRGEGGGDA